MAKQQAERFLQLQSPLGADQLWLTSFRGQEELSRLFDYELAMISENTSISATDIVGKGVTFSVRLPDDSFRHFHGIVNRLYAGDESDGVRNYRAKVVPWLWFLTRTSDCRIFQQKSVPDILEQVFQDLGFSDFEISASGHHPTRDYCVQYRETDFQFVSRLLEEEGMFYFFTHEEGKHKLVIADRATSYYDLPEAEVDYPGDVGEIAREDHITRWEHLYEFRSGKWAQTDYNFETPSDSLMTQTNTVIGLPPNDRLEFYDYPGRYGQTSDGQPLTDVRMEEDEAQHDIVEGSSLCRTFSPGGKFTVRQHRCSSEAGKKYVITKISHEAYETMAYESSRGAPPFGYRNEFRAIPDQVAFRPQRITPKPYVRGVQTATVVGPSGEEIYTDEFGRIKAQFHWDREGSKDENSSCWMRVSQIHAGKGFGGIDIPRIGEEVIVSFLEGDPDRPIITGRVYHAENMPPYGLPDKKVISGIKSKTYKGDGYNEYVMDDSPGNELIREHGQFDKDSTIEHDLREHVLNNRSRDVSVDETVSVGKNQSLTVGVNRTIQVGANHSETIAANMTINVGANLVENVAVNYAETVGAAMALTVGGVMTQTIGGAFMMVVGGAVSATVGGTQSTIVQADRKEQVKGKVVESVKGDVTQKIDGKHTEKVKGKYTVKGDASMLLQAADEIVLKTGASSITLKKSGEIKIKGNNITVEATASLKEKALTIKSEASTSNTVKGTMVTVDAATINNVKGALVKIN